MNKRRVGAYRGNMSNIEYIQKALDIALKECSEDNDIKASFNNVDTPTDTSIPYLSSANLNTGVGNADLGVSDIRGGIYQVDIHYESNTGTAAFNKMADLVNKKFKSGACFNFNGVCVNITSCEPTQILINNGWGVLPMNITWTSYTSRI